MGSHLHKQDAFGAAVVDKDIGDDVAVVHLPDTEHPEGRDEMWRHLLVAAVCEIVCWRPVTVDHERRHRHVDPTGLFLHETEAPEASVVCSHIQSWHSQVSIPSIGPATCRARCTAV